MAWSTDTTNIPSGVNNPRGLAVDTNGDWLLVAADTDLIYVSADRGVTWGTGIRLPSGVLAPRGLAVDTNGDWLLLDAATDGIYVSVDKGATWGSKISLPAGMVNPSGISVDRNGDWLVVGYTLDGIYVSVDKGATWGSKISLPAGVNNPTGLTVTLGGDWLLIDQVTDQIYVSVDKGIRWLPGRALPNGATLPRGLAVDTNGDWLLVDAQTDKIYIYEVVKIVAMVDSGSGSTSGGFDSGFDSGFDIRVGVTVPMLDAEVTPYPQPANIWSVASGLPEVFAEVTSINTLYRLEVDWNNDGNFDHVHSDVFPDTQSLTARRGRNYGSMIQGKSEAGVLRATLRNDDGKYDRFNVASPLHNLAVPGRRVRFRIKLPSDAVPTTIWGGRLFEIDTQPRSGGADQVRLIAYGPLSELAQQEISVPMQSGGNGISTGDAAVIVLEAAGFGVSDRGPMNGSRRMQRWWTRRQKALESVRELEDTELGFFYETKDGKPAMEAENARLTGGINTRALLSDRVGIGLPLIDYSPIDPVKDIVNAVHVPVRSYSIAASATLWELPAPVFLGAGDRLTLLTEYPSPDDAASVIGVEGWDGLVSGTDYLANSAADGSGTDRTAQLSVTAVDTATGRILTLQNTDTINDIYVTRLQCKGRSVTEGDPLVVIEKNQDSIDAYDEKTYLTPSQFISDTRDATSYAQHLLQVLKDPQIKGDAVIDVSDHLDIAKTIDLSHAVRVAIRGHSEIYFVETIQHRLMTRERHHIELRLSPAIAFENIITLDIGPALGTGALAR